MCAVSVINDYGHYRIPLNTWTPDTWGQYQDILRRLAELDKKLGEPDCETAGKLEWQNAVEARLAKLEAKPAPRKARSRSVHPEDQK
jgi:hypothetical protein